MGVVLFDVDGVLRDSYGAHVRVWRAWCARRGLNGSAIGLQTFGRRPRDVVVELAPDADVGAELAVLDRLLAQDGAMAPMPGARDLLQGLPRHRWAIVTSGDQREVLAWFAAAQLPAPPVAVFGSEVPRGKPDPACYALSAQRVGVAPRDCLVVEDVPAGVQAGRAAGVTVLGIGSSHDPDALSADHYARTLTEASELIESWIQRPAAPAVDPVPRLSCDEPTIRSH